MQSEPFMVHCRLQKNTFKSCPFSTNCCITFHLKLQLLQPISDRFSTISGESVAITIQWMSHYVVKNENKGIRSFTKDLDAAPRGVVMTSSMMEEVMEAVSIVTSSY